MNRKQRLTFIYLLALIQGISFAIIKILILTSPLLILLFSPHDMVLSSIPLGMNMVGTALGIVPFSLVQRTKGSSTACIYFSLLGFLGILVAILSIALKSILMLSFGLFMFGLFNGSLQYYRFIAMGVAGDDSKLINKAVSFVIFGGLISTGVTPVVLRLIMHNHTHSYASYYLIYFISMVLCCAIIIIWRTKLSQIKIDHSRTERQDDSFWLATIISSVAYFVMVFLMTPATPYLKLMGLSFSSISVVMQAHFIGMFLPSIFVGDLINKLGRLRIALIGFWIMIVGALVLMCAHGTILFALGLGAVGVGWNFSFIAGSSMLHKCSSREQMKNTLIIFLIAAIGSASSGFVLFTFGWKFLNALSLFLCVLVIFLKPYHKLIEKHKC